MIGVLKGGWTVVGKLALGIPVMGKLALGIPAEILSATLGLHSRPSDWCGAVQKVHGRC